MKELGQLILIVIGAGCVSPTVPFFIGVVCLAVLLVSK